MWPFSNSKKASCECAHYAHLTLDRKAILKRIKESKMLKKRLQVVVDDKHQAVTLFCCPDCGEMWQSGREWNFANEEYLFRVPPITEEEWQQEHYCQPAAMMIYSASMEMLYARAKFTRSTDMCRFEGCSEQALSIGVYCEKHHIESLQKNGLLAKPPRGRLFPPYYKNRKVD